MSEQETSSSGRSRTVPSRPEAAEPATGAAVDSGPAAGAPMAEADRHGFVSAFIGGVRPDAERSRSGRRLLTIGVGVAVVTGVGALIVGAVASGSGKPAAKESGPAAQPTVTALAPTPAAAAVTPGAQTGAPAEDQNGAPGGGSGGGGGQLPQPGAAATVTATATATATVPPPAAPPAQPGAPAKATYSAVAGPGCSDRTTEMYYKDADYSLGTSGWLRSSTGGYRGEGCDGSYVAMPMSGSATKYDGGQGVLWHFDLTSRFSSGSCSLAVYVPANTDSKYVGGNPSHYFLWNKRYDYGMSTTPTNSFDIVQVSNRGAWVNAGSFKVDSGQVTLKLVNTGVDYGSTSGAHHAAAPVRLNCTAA